MVDARPEDPADTAPEYGDAEADASSWVTPIRVLTLGVALMFLAGVVGYRIGLPDRPGEKSADVGFLQDMIVHHQQAVAMSFATADVASDAVVRAFAKEILSAQQYEIGLMDSWLRGWKQPRESRDQMAMGWAGQAHPKLSMPGMASDQELEAMYAAKGLDVDDRFLRLMTAHHVGGLAMAEAYLERGDNGKIRELAKRILRNQKGEINEMQYARRRLGLNPAPVETSMDHGSSGPDSPSTSSTTPRTDTSPSTRHH